MSDGLKEKTAKGLFWGGLSNGVQQLLNLIFGIFLARLLTPADYGMVGMLAIFSLIAATLQESGFTAALANKKEVSHRDYNAVFWFSVLTGCTLYLLLFFASPLIAAFYEIPELTALARYSFLGFLISSFGVAQNAYLFRNLMVKQKSISLIVALLVSGCVGVTMAYFGFAYWGIATQSIVYIATINLCYLYFSPWRPTFNFDFSPIRSMFVFSSKLLLTNIFKHLNDHILTIILGKYYSDKDAGYFSQAHKWNYMGHSLISGMVNGVAQPVLVSTGDERERLQRVFRKMLRFTAFIAFPAMWGLALIVPELIPIAITDKWLPCVPILQILCIGGAFIPIITLYTNMIISRGRSDIYMFGTIAIGLIQMLVMWLLHPYGMQRMVVVYVILNSCWLLVWHYFVWREIKLSLLSALKDLLPFAVITAMVLFATYHLTACIANAYLLMLSKIAVAALLYMGIMWLSGAKIFKESIQFLFKRKV
jgi:O-antigen/teichoic acid export membrane protein